MFTNNPELANYYPSFTAEFENPIYRDTSKTYYINMFAKVILYNYTRYSYCSVDRAIEFIGDNPAYYFIGHIDNSHIIFDKGDLIFPEISLCHILNKLFPFPESTITGIYKMHNSFDEYNRNCKHIQLFFKI